MNDKINLTKTNGTTIEVDTICFIEDTTNSKRYIYYTLNELVGTGPSSTVKIYVGKVRQNDANLDAPITDEEWGKLKGYMGNALKDAPLENVKYLPLSQLTDAAITDEKVIAMPTSYDYVNKHRGIYAQAVATDENTVGDVATVTPVVPQEPVAPVEPTPIEPTPVPMETTPEPIIQEPTPIVPEPIMSPETQAPVMQEMGTPAVESEGIPSVEPTPVENNDTPVPPVENQANLNPIDINEIEAKYAKMIEDINNLKAQEIEAANRYNSTLELNAMHIEQHASYVANEQNKEVNAPMPDATPNPFPTVEPTPVAAEPAAPSVEPAPTSGPIIPESAPAPTNPQDIETNWFDMPIQG